MTMIWLSVPPSGRPEPGVPVLVKMSYFPNWSVSGAEGPYRVTPNLMVVIPTDTEVSFTYDRTPPDLIGAALTVLGLIGLVVLARRPVVDVPEHNPSRLSEWIDRRVALPERVAALEARATTDPEPTVVVDVGDDDDIWIARDGDDTGTGQPPRSGE